MRRVRLHDATGAVAVQSRPGGEWSVINGAAWQTWMTDEHVHQPGWRELVVLDPEADALRLAAAMWGSEPPSTRVGRAIRCEEAEFYLGRLAAESEGKRDV